MAAKFASSKSLKLKSDLSKSLANLLECPVCLEIMVPPIIQCLNGHNICSSCKPRLNLCPTCRVDLAITSRNVALENIAETFVDNHGKVKSSGSSQHRKYECLAGKAKGCTWKGRRSELWTHVRQHHADQAMFWRKESQLFHVAKHDFNASGFSTHLISFFDELFWYHFRQDSSKDKWCQAVQYIGAKNKASKFRYTLQFGPVAEDFLKRSIVYSSVTHSDEENMDHTLKFSYSFSTDLNSVKHFVAKDNSLRFKLKIEKI